MPYNFLLAMAAQKLTPDTGPDLMFHEPPAALIEPEVVDPPFDPAPQLSVTRFGAEQSGRSETPDDPEETQAAATQADRSRSQQ